MVNIIYIQSVYQVFEDQPIGGNYYKASKIGGSNRMKLIAKKVKKHQVSKNEISNWKKIKGKYVQELIEYDEVEDYFYFIIEESNGGTLYERVMEQKNQQMKEAQVKNLFKHIILGYKESLYEKGIIFKNFTSESIIIHNGFPKIADFGVTRNHDSNSDDNLNKKNCNNKFTPPEYGNSSCDWKYDVYSLGSLMYFCLYGKSPHPENAKKFFQFFKELEEEKGFVFEERKVVGEKILDPRLKNLIISMMSFHSHKRPDLFEILEVLQPQLTLLFLQSQYDPILKIIQSHVQSLKECGLSDLSKITFPKVVSSSQIKELANQEIIDQYFLFTLNQITFSLLVLNSFLHNFIKNDQKKYRDYIASLFISYVTSSYEYLQQTISENNQDIPESLKKRLPNAYAKYKKSSRCQNTRDIINKMFEDWKQVQKQIIIEIRQNFSFHENDVILFQNFTYQMFSDFIFSNPQDQDDNTISKPMQQSSSVALAQKIDSTYSLIVKILKEYWAKIKNSIEKYSSKGERDLALYLVLLFINKKDLLNSKFDSFSISQILSGDIKMEQTQSDFNNQYLISLEY